MTAMKWIKLSTALFEDDKMLLLEGHEDGQALQLLWVKLLCLAGKQGKEGVFLLKEGVPYTSKMLAEIFRMEEPVVKRGLRLFCQFGMLHRQEGAWVITNWSRHQNMTAYEKKLNYDREYKRRRKSEQSSSFLELAMEEP